MSAAITIVCDGQDRTCDRREVVVLAETPGGARDRLRRYGWAHVEGLDLCRDCQVDPQGSLTEAGVTSEPHWSDR